MTGPCASWLKAGLAAALVVLVAAGTALAAQAGAPLEMAGLRLGSDLSAVADQLVMETRVTDDTYAGLASIQQKPRRGFRSVYASFGECSSKGRLLRIKCNYELDAKHWFEKILATLKSRYGNPTAWRGDPFGNLKVWKWSLKDPDLGNVSLILSYYPGDDDAFTKGISLRLSAQDLVDLEADCQRARLKAKMPPPEPAEADFESLLPR